MPRKPTRPPVVCEFFTWRIFERDGVLYADGRTGKHNLGKHSLGTRVLAEALTNLRELDRKKAVELGLTTLNMVSPTTSPSLADGWALYLKHCERPQVLGGVSAATLKRYNAVRAKHLAFAAGHGIQTWADVTKANVEQYSALLTQRGYADRTIYLEVDLLKSVVRWLIDEGMLPSSSKVYLPLRKPQGTDVYCPTQDEVVAMIAHCRSRPELQWLAAVIIGLACTGLRISELASLRWSDLDLRSGMIRLTDERASIRRRRQGSVRTTKGRRDRTLPIHRELQAVLLAMERHSDGRVFHGPRNGKLKADTVRVILIREVLVPLKGRYPTPPGEVGFEHLRPHSLRHYFCSQAFLGGASEAEIKEWLGHADSRMVAHYRHLGEVDSQRKMQGIDFLGRGDRAERSLG